MTKPVNSPNPRRKPEVNILLHLLGRFIFWVTGWRAIGHVPENPKMIIVAGPHTSNVDGAIMVFTSWVVRVRLKWMVKIELTRGPLGWLIKALGGVPVDRSASRNLVDQIVQEFAARDDILLAIAPEGTRRKSDHWKTGFYWMAVKAEVPIMLGKLDYKHRTIDLSAPLLHPTGDIDADMAWIWAEYEGVTARFPEKVNDMRLRPSGRRVPGGQANDETAANEA